MRKGVWRGEGVCPRSLSPSEAVSDKAQGSSHPKQVPLAAEPSVNGTFCSCSWIQLSPGAHSGLPLPRPLQLRVPSRLWSFCHVWQKLCPLRVALPPHLALRSLCEYEGWAPGLALLAGILLHRASVRTQTVGHHKQLLTAPLPRLPVKARSS